MSHTSTELLPFGYSAPLTELNKMMERFHYFIRHAKLDSKTYQEEGVKWCVYRELVDRCDGEKRGGFLSDEMGLGKTITMLGTIFTNFRKGRSTLIVLPCILLKQWYVEILRMTGRKSVIFHGKGKKVLKKEDLEQSPIVLTTYGSLSKHSCLFDVKWFRVVYDEAHHLRNKNTIIHQRAMFIKTKICWFVSGTPIQNKIADFKNVCLILGIHITSMNVLQEVIQTSVLKRIKKTADIVIPEISYENIDVEWKDDNEKTISDGFHELLKFRKTEQTDQMEEALNAYNISEWNFHTTFLTALNKLYPSKELVLLNTIKSRQMCVLPSLVGKLLTKLADLIPSTESNEWNRIIQSLPRYQSKIKSVVNKLIERKGAEGKLVFCHFREEMAKIKQMLCERGFDENEISIIDGSVSSKKRSICINQHPKILILQIQTACEGLNLQEHYSEIYFVSPNWNPAIEQQAIARCHRIGQQKQVYVFRFYMTEKSTTIEEWIFIKQKKKIKHYL